MADNLESYFKKHLSDDTPAKDEWNVPPDSVWEKAAPRIRKRKGLFILWKYLYLLVPIAGLALWFLLWPSNTDNTTSLKQINTERTVPKVKSSKINANKNSATPIIEESASPARAAEINSDKESGTAAVKGSSVVNETLPKEGALISLEDKMVSDEKLAANNQLKVTGIDKGTGRNGNEQLREEESTTAEVDFTESLPVNAAENFATQRQPITRLEQIPPESRLVVLSKTKTTRPELVMAPVLPGRDLPSISKARVGVGAYFAPTLTSTYLNGNPDQGNLETGDLFLFSGNWGVEFRYPVSRLFTLFGGIGKTEIKSWSKSQSDFNYDLSTEHPVGTIMTENTSPVSMSTPFGDIETEITYRFPRDQTIPDDNLMQSVMESNQEIKYLSIPLGVEYKLYRFSHFSWFAVTGLRYNRAFKDATQFSSQILHNGGEMDVVDEKMTSQLTYTENYLNLFIGTGINYQFSKSMQLAGSARYSRSITPVNLQNNMATRLHEISLKIGLVHFF